MKASREKVAERRDAMIAAASRLYRERGLNGASIAEIMNSVGLTHGAFYNHFDSKSAFCAAAVKRAFEDRAAGWRDDLSLTGYIDQYLSTAHRDGPGTGCPIVMFGSTMARQKRNVKTAYAHGVTEFVGRIAFRLPGGAGESKNLRNAVAILTAMAGGVMLARSVSSEEQLSVQILQESRIAISRKFGV